MIPHYYYYDKKGKEEQTDFQEKIDCDEMQAHIE